VRLVEPFTFFVDRSLGSGVVADALRAVRERVVIHDDHFATDAPDTEWLTKVGAHRWVVLTKDARIRTNALERNALLAANVAAFMLGRGDASGPAMARTFVAALPRIKTSLRRFEVPLVGVVAVGGGVSVLYASGIRLSKPRVVK
jgi:hypothetical protein